jgi:trigger factor
MPSQKTHISKTRVKFAITIPAEEMTRFFNEEYEHLAPTIALPGFRAGKAPRVMTVEAIGQGRLAQGALEKALDKGYREALLEHKLYPVTQPAISISKHPVYGTDETQNELSFEVEFDILPEAKIGDYKKIRITKIDPEKLKVTDEEVEKVIQYLLRQQATLSEIDRKVVRGDWVQISFKGSMKGVSKEKLTSPSLPIVLGETQMIPGFEDQVAGMKKGEQKKFTLKFPKDFQDKEFAGQDVDFELKLEEAKEIELPKLTDEFAKKFGNDTVSAMKKAIRKSLEDEKAGREKQIQRAQISEELIKMTRVEIPQSLVESETARLKTIFEKDLSARQMTLEQYIDQIKMKKEKLEEELKAQAKRNITLGVALGEVAKAEGLALGTADSTDKVFEKIVGLNAK